MDTQKKQTNRYIIIDFLRGLGLLLMFIFHLVLDINFFRLIKITFLNNPYWLGFGRFILIIFLVCVGIGLRIVHKNGIKWNLVRKRFYKIGGWALIITIVTFILLPKHFIFFGVLHCIALSSVIGVFLVNKPKLSLLLCLMLLIPYLIFQQTLMPVSKWLGVASADYTPLYPWISMVFLGIYLESIGFHKIPLKEKVPIKFFQIMGRHSLKIYLLHQPILLCVLFFISTIRDNF